MSNFVLTLPLKTQPFQEVILNKRMEIGRQMYNACLIMNVNDDLKTINRDWCFEKFGIFKELHDIEIVRIRNSKSKLISSMGVQ